MSNTTTPNENLTKKIRDLLRMADPANGATQNEMEVAMSKAKELMTRHGIESMDLGEATERPVGVTEEKINTGRKKRDEDRWIPTVLKKVFEVEVLYSAVWDSSVGRFGGYRHAYILIGAPQDVEMARLVLPMIYDAMRLGLNRHLRETGRSWNTHTANSFFRGVADGFIKSSVHGHQAAMRQFKKEEQDRFAIVLVNKKEAIAAHLSGMKLVTKKSRSRAGHDERAHSAGFQVGSSIDATTKLK